MKKLIFLFFILILLSACGSSSQCLQLSPNSNVMINPQFSFLKETLADQKIGFYEI